MLLHLRASAWPQPLRTYAYRDTRRGPEDVRWRDQAAEFCLRGEKWSSSLLFYSSFFGYFSWSHFCSRFHFHVTIRKFHYLIRLLSVRVFICFSPHRSWPILRFCSVTSPPPAWTRSWPRTWWAWWRAWLSGARQCCPPSTSPALRCSPCSTASCSSLRAEWPSSAAATRRCASLASEWRSCGSEVPRCAVPWFFLQQVSEGIVGVCMRKLLLLLMHVSVSTPFFRCTSEKLYIAEVTHGFKGSFFHCFSDKLTKFWLH